MSLTMDQIHDIRENKTQLENSKKVHRYGGFHRSPACTCFIGNPQFKTRPVQIIDRWMAAGRQTCYKC